MAEPHSSTEQPWKYPPHLYLAITAKATIARKAAITITTIKVTTRVTEVLVLGTSLMSMAVGSVTKISVFFVFRSIVTHNCATQCDANVRNTYRNATCNLVSS